MNMQEQEASQRYVERVARIEQGQPSSRSPEELSQEALTPNFRFGEANFVCEWIVICEGKPVGVVLNSEVGYVQTCADCAAELELALVPWEESPWPDSREMKKGSGQMPPRGWQLPSLSNYRPKGVSRSSDGVWEPRDW